MLSVSPCIMPLYFPTFERRVLVQQETVRHTRIAQPLDNYLTVRRQGEGESAHPGYIGC